MRIDIHAINTPMTAAQRAGARRRLEQAAAAAEGRLVWAGLWLVDHSFSVVHPRYCCRLDAWLSNLGVVSVTLFDAEAERAIDKAIAWLEQAMRRRIEDSTRPPDDRDSGEGITEWRGEVRTYAQQGGVSCG